MHKWVGTIAKKDGKNANSLLSDILIAVPSLDL